MATKTYDVNGFPVVKPQHLQRGFERANPEVKEWPEGKPQNAEEWRNDPNWGRKDK